MEDFVLNSNQKKILKKLSFLDENFYLAGGTALALHFGHRTSFDFDFYADNNFNSIALAKNFQEVFENNLEGSRYAEDTLWLTINNVDVSFFKYPYSLIKPTVDYNLIKLASPEDILAMKMQALVGRGKKRDFVDMYFGIKKYSLENIFEFCRQKYGKAFEEYNAIIALTYFKDAEVSQKDRKKIYIYSGVTWSEIKKYITREAEKYQRNLTG